jgi:DNA (cytosine-5)-methyltransferase 1
MVSLFSGAGGLDLGLEMAGFVSLGMNEIDHDCCETLRANRQRLANPDVVVVESDIAELEPRALMRRLGLRHGQLALLAGGPPCQAFTTTGRRRALADERGSTVKHYLRMLNALVPRYFLMENVTGFFSAALRHRPLNERGKGHKPLAPDEQKGSVLKWFLGELNRAGYTVTWGVLDAVDFGVPQFRQRAFLIGVRHGDPLFLPGPTRFEGSEHVRKWQTLADALSGLIDPHPLVQPLSETKKRVLRHIPAGGNWRSLTTEQRRATMGQAFHAEGGKGGWWRRLAWDRPSPTILTMPDHSSTALIHPDEVRCLSVRECARCQTFPNDWMFEGSSRSQYRQIGNAVPVVLAAKLGREIRRHMNGYRMAHPRPPVWRQASANHRLGTWGWVTSEGEVTILNRRSDHVDLDESRQLVFADVA